MFTQAGTKARQFLGRLFPCSLAMSLGLLWALASPAQAPPEPKQLNFPATDQLLPRVAQHQKEIESLVNQYTFTDTTTVYTLDKSEKVQSQHTDVYFVTPTVYEVFTLHVSHDGKPVTPSDLQKQEKEIERKLRDHEKKSVTPGDLHPKEMLLFSDVILKSRFTPLRWEPAEGKRLIVYAFEPKSPAQPGGELASRIAGDMKGTVWIDPEDAAVTRMEFASVAALRLGMGFLGKIRGFEGYVEQRKIQGEIWLPSHQEFVAQGRELIKGFRIRQVSDFSAYLKATTDVFQQIHSPVGASDVQR